MHSQLPFCRIMLSFSVLYMLSALSCELCNVIFIQTHEQHSSNKYLEFRWPGGRVKDLGARGPGFET